MGWTYKEAAETDVNSIMVAMEGYLECNYPEQVASIKAKEVPFKDKFLAAVKKHNAQFRAKKAQEE